MIGETGKNGTEKHDIKTQLQNAIKKSKEEDSLFYKNVDLEVEQQAVLRKQIVREAIETLTNNPDKASLPQIMRGLTTVIIDNSVHYRFAHYIYEDIQKIFSEELHQMWLENNETPLTELPKEVRRSVETVNFLKNLVPRDAAEFFKEKIYREIAKYNYADKLGYIEEMFTFAPKHLYPFLYTALKEVQSEIENDIAEQKRIADRNKEFEFLEPEETGERNKQDSVSFVDSPTSKYVEPRDSNQVYLALRVLLSLTDLQGPELDKFMSFLSGYSANTFYGYRVRTADAPGNWKDKQEKFDRALSYISLIKTINKGETFSKTISELKEICKDGG
jgi:hypothetical protein